MNPSRSLQIVRVLDGLAVAEIANACIVVWRGPVTQRRFEAQREALAEVVIRHQEGVGFFCVIEPTATPPNDALRRASADMIRKHQSALRGIACVVEGSGFINAVARSALSAMALLVGPRRVPLAVLGSVSAGAMWMAPHILLHDSAALAQAVEMTRGHAQPWR